MRLHFQEKPWDLYVTVGYALAIAVVLFILDTGNLLAILLVFFVPGYVLVAALFPGAVVPGNLEIDWIERVALSLGMSIAVVSLLGLLLNFTSLGLRFLTIDVAIAVFTVSVGYAAYWRRIRLPADRRLSLTVGLAMPSWNEHGVVDKGLTLALVMGIVVATGFLAYAVVTLRPGEPFTEFYLLGPRGDASGYPTRLTVNETGNVIVGVVNQEGTTIDYTVRVDLVGVRIVYNTTTKTNETVEMNRTTWSRLNVTLGDGKNWTQHYTFSILSAALWKVQFLLYKNGVLSSQELHLFVRVA